MPMPFPVNRKCSLAGASRLLFLLLATLLAVTLALGGLGLLSPNTTWAASTKWRGKGEVDVLLGVETDDERWDVDDLLADAGNMLVAE